jgi:hypothetical protein
MRLGANSLDGRVREAVARFWDTRELQASKQRQRGGSDQGARSAVTGGAQMDGFIELVSDLIRDAGIPDAAVFKRRDVELPGFFRATKDWDMLVVVDGRLLVVIEAKSQVGPSFGNNFNNRTEEAIGSAVDLWTAYRDGAYVDSPRPWLGYLFLLEDSDRSSSPVSVREPHFKVFDEFRGASYAKRYEVLCRKLVRERHYDAAAFLLSNREAGIKGGYAEPASDLTFRGFATSLIACVSAYVAMRGQG